QCAWWTSRRPIRAFRTSTMCRTLGPMTCPSCAAVVPEGSRFCPSCGHALSVLPNEERRIVTVLFADLVGFTTLAEYMDPEQAKRLVERAFARLVDDVT